MNKLTLAIKVASALHRTRRAAGRAVGAVKSGVGKAGARKVGAPLATAARR